MKHYYTSESVTVGHPDKTCDTIADAFLDEALRQDPNSMMAVECAIKNDKLFVYGEATTNANIDYDTIAKNILKDSAAFVNEIPAVIESYAKLASKYSAPLNGNLSIFKLTNAKKHTLFNLTTELDPETNQEVNVLNELQSEYNETYLNNVRLVLNHFFRLSTEEVSA